MKTVIRVFILDHYYYPHIPSFLPQSSLPIKIHATSMTFPLYRNINFTQSAQRL